MQLEIDLPLQYFWAFDVNRTHDVVAPKPSVTDLNDFVFDTMKVVVLPLGKDMMNATTLLVRVENLFDAFDGPLTAKNVSMDSLINHIY